jgi:hypothetical protein
MWVGLWIKTGKIGRRWYGSFIVYVSSYFLDLEGIFADGLQILRAVT